MLVFVVLVLAGLFCIFCAAMNYDWFIGHRKAELFLKLFGRTGTRIFYVILGIIIIALAIMAYLNGQIVM